MKTTHPRVTPTSSLPVSRKFYNELLSRIDHILQALFNDAAAAYFESAKRMIDSYLADRLEAIPHDDIIPEVHIIFVTLKAEIDRARQRSLRARTAARSRRVARTHTAVTHSPSPAATTSSILTTPSPESTAPSSTAPTTPTTPTTPTQEAPIDSNVHASSTIPASETPTVPTPPHVIKNIPNPCPDPKRHPSLKWKPSITCPKQHSKHPYTHFKPARKH